MVNENQPTRWPKAFLDGPFNRALTSLSPFITLTSDGDATRATEVRTGPQDERCLESWNGSGTFLAESQSPTQNRINLSCAPSYQSGEHFTNSDTGSFCCRFPAVRCDRGCRNVLVNELAEDTSIQAADTLLLTAPN
jgi:hypothetical protein